MVKVLLVAMLLTVYSTPAKPEQFMRSSQARLFPIDAEPPEETVELWMGKRQVSKFYRTVRPRTNTDDCLTAAKKRTPRTDLLSALWCIRGIATCSTDSDLTLRDLRRCLSSTCVKLCRDVSNVTQCMKRACRVEPRSVGSDVEPRSVRSGVTRDEQPSDDVTGLSQRGSYGSLKTDRSNTLKLFRVLSQGDYPRPNHLKEGRELDAIVPEPDGLSEMTSQALYQPGQSREKRYRLGLYDCISSYCSNLHGEDRKSCIVNYCHRSSTLKM